MIGKLGKLLITGSFNLDKYIQVNPEKSNSQKLSVSSMTVVINSYGGSIRSADAVSHALKKYREEKYRVPIFCFAEDYCLNSANIVLTMGTKVYANKLSTLGQFGFVQSAFDISQFSERYKIGESSISQLAPGKIKLTLTDGLNINSRSALQTLATKSEAILKQGILENRARAITASIKSTKTFQQNIFTKTIIEPHYAEQNGLIDGVTSFQEWRENNFNRNKIVEFGAKKFENPMMNVLAQAQELLFKN